MQEAKKSALNMIGTWLKKGNVKSETDFLSKERQNNRYLCKNKNWWFTVSVAFVVKI